MSTFLPIDETLIRHSELTEKVSENLLFTIIENYNSGNISLGHNHGEIISEIEIYYTLVGSEFENEFLTLKYKDSAFGQPYHIVFECKGNDSTSEFVVNLSDEMVDQLPQSLKDKMTDKLHQILTE